MLRECASRACNPHSLNPGVPLLSQTWSRPVVTGLSRDCKPAGAKEDSTPKFFPRLRADYADFKTKNRRNPGVSVEKQINAFLATRYSVPATGYCNTAIEVAEFPTP